MYISIGNSMQLRDKSIIGIFDLDNTTSSRATREFLKQNEQNGQVITACDDLPKSFLLSREYGMDRVYLLQPNSRTMGKRLASTKHNRKHGFAGETE